MAGVEDSSNPGTQNQEEEKKPLDGAGQHINLKVKGQVGFYSLPPARVFCDGSQMCKSAVGGFRAGVFFFWSF